MSKPFEISLSGWDEFIEKMAVLPEKVFSEVDAVVQVGGSQWEQLAKRSAPVDQGPLRAQITNRKTGEMANEITSPKLYSPFLEWGTRRNTHVPAELVAYALQFKGITAPGGAKAIFDWCRRVGIPPDAWYFVYIKIMREGITPHPYFFIHSETVEKQVMSDIRQILETEH
jgi:hypothetical protein